MYVHSSEMQFFLGTNQTYLLNVKKEHLGFTTSCSEGGASLFINHFGASLVRPSSDGLMESKQILWVFFRFWEVPMH